MRQLALRRPGRTFVMPVQHLSAVEIAAFIDRPLSAGARAAAERHLSACARCREELAACMRLASTAPARRAFRVSWPLVGSIAAAMLFVVVLRPVHRQASVEPARERSAVIGADSIAIAPTADRAVARRDLRLVWRRDPAAVSYRVVVTDSAGAPTWRSDDVTDTSIAPPSSVALVPRARYFWRVDALHGDGSSAQSATSGFRITP
jgi:hypothetical protein